MRARVDFRGSLPPARGLAATAARPSTDLVPLVLRWTVLLLPLNWICGTTPVWCYAATLLLLSRARTWSALEALFLWLIAAFALGLMVGLLRGAPFDRGLASIYNMTIVVVLIAFLNGAETLYAPDREVARATLYRVFAWLFAANVALVALIYAVTKATGVYDVAVRTLVLGLAGHLPGVLGEYGQVDLAVTDWTLGGPETRVIGFGIYATEGALIFLLSGLLGEVALFARGRRCLVVLSEAAIAVGLWIMASRTTLGAYILSLLLLAPLQRGKAATTALIFGPAVLVGGVLVALYGTDSISHWLAARNEERLGSSDTRFLSYTTAISMVLAQNPLTGLGIKPLDLSLMEIPIGSHSTLSSTFAKGGFVALGVLGAIFAVLIGGVIRSQALLWSRPAPPEERVARFELVQLSRGVLVTLLWWTTEDFDAPAHESVLAGLCFGLFWAALRQATKRRAAF